MVKAETEVDFLQNFQGFQGILAKSLENLTFFGQCFKKTEAEVDFFGNIQGFKLKFFKFSLYFSKKFEKQAFFL